MMPYLMKVYSHLLADIGRLTKCRLDAPQDLSCEWVLIEAPKLEKQLLAYVEGTRAEWPELPEWIKPLWMKFYVYDDGFHLRMLRQLLLFCYKVELEPTNEQLSEAQASFVETDRMCGVWSAAFSSMPEHPLIRIARQIVLRVICRGDWSEIVPSHGPGAVYPSFKPWNKSCFRSIYRPIEEKYPFTSYFCGIPSFWDRWVWHGDAQLTSEDTIRARLVSVPKDSRGPRLICVHPKEAIWVQQGQRRVLEDLITRHPLTRGRINFTDQTVNGNLALESSRSRKLVTIDLKEASDRISCSLVRALFGAHAYEWLSCSRASEVRLLDTRVITLQKWAPMGNCLTFPVQSLLFYSIVRAGIFCHYGEICNDVYVFGDDILFPSKYYDGAVWALVMCGLVPNMSKTFRTGFFRESCGVDAYRGVDVTPLRMKQADIVSVSNAQSQLDLAKRLRLAGFEACACFIYSMVSKRYGRLAFCNDPRCQGFVEYVNRDFGWLILNEPSLRFRKDTHQWVVKNRLVKGAVYTVSTGDWYHLQDSLLRLTRMGEMQSDRRTEYPIPYRERLTYGWSECVTMTHLDRD